MPQTINDELIQERLAQLNAIVARRNEFLLELFRMMRTKRDINYALSDTEDEEGDLEAFLQRFDLSKDPVAGSISNLEEDETLFTKQILQPEESPSATSNSKPVSSARTTRSRSRALEIVQSPPAPTSLENTESESLVDIESPRRSEERQQSPPVSSPAHKPSPPIPISVVPQMVVNDEEDEDEDNDELDLLRSSDVAEVENRPSDNVAIDEHATTTTLDGDAEKEKELPTVEPPVSSLLSIKGDVEVHTPTETRAAEPLESSSDPSPASPPSPLTTATIEEDNTLTPEPNQATEQMSVDTPDNQAESPPPPAEPVTSPVPEVKEEVIMEEVIEEQPQSENHKTEMDESMQDVSMDLDSDDVKHDAPPSSPVVVVDENIAQPALVPAPAPVIPYIPIHIPLPPSIQEKIFIPAPTSTTEEVHYNVDVESEIRKPPPESNEDELHINPQYPLPPLSILPADFTRKAKPIRRKKEKESKRDKEKDDAIPMGLARWGATAMANPVYTKVARATKCLNTREWGVAMAELRLIRTLDRIETLKDGGRWSFRQPKKQRGVGGLTKTHWDYLLDEMKWMRIDFREERRWKLALAYNLSTSVLEWHHAKTPEERLREGICVKWKVSQFKDNEPKNIEMNILSDNAMEINGVDVPEATQDATTSNPPIPRSALLGINYGSEDEDEDEKEKSSSNIVDSLAPSALIEDALNHTDDIQPKNEEVDDQTAITLLHQMPHNRETVEADNGDNAMTIDDLKGLKTSSNNPVLGDPKSSSQSTNGDAEPPNASTKLSPAELAPLRERIVYSLDDQLFMDIDTLTTQNTASGETKPTSESADLMDLASLFPELQPLTMLDVAPPVAPLEGKKKPEKKLDRDDPNKRIEDTTYTKLYPVGRFMYSKPTLIGPLQPSKRFRDGKWSPVEQVSIVPDPDFSVKISEDNTSELFDGKPPPNFLMAGFKDRDGRKAKLAETLWSPADDTLIKSLVDKYSTNWALIAECFNSSRLTTVIDRRTPTDLYDRWKDKFGAADRKQLHTEPSQSAVDDASASTSANQMTTRGVKRLASTSVSNTNPQGPTTTESRKRRKHALLQESVRKAAKKRAETAQKMLANQRKAPAIHETHNQFNNLPKFSPQELSRMKAEKDMRDGAADAIARKRQDEQVRQTLLMREQAQRTGALPVQAQAQQQQQQQPQQQQQAQQGQPQPQQQPQQPTGLQTPQPLQQPPPTATQVQQQHLAQLQQLQQIQAQAQAHQAALQRANGNAPAAALTNRPGRLSAVPTARTVSQQQATLLQHARAMQIPVQANGQTNLPQALLTHAQLPGNAAVHAPGPPFYSLPNLTQEQIEMFQAQLMNAQQQQQQQQQQQHQSETNTTNFPAQSQQ